MVSGGAGRDRLPWNQRLGLGDRLKLSLLITLILIIVLALSSLIPLSSEEAQSILRQVEELFGDKITFMDIWMNNLLIALLMHIPFIGPGIGGFAIIQTGRVFGALAAQTGVSSILFILIAILAIYGLVEFLAYGVAFTEGVLLSYSIVKKSLRSELTWVPVSLGISIGLLLAAALLEALLIQLFQPI